MLDQRIDITSVNMYIVPYCYLPRGVFREYPLQILHEHETIGYFQFRRLPFLHSCIIE